MATRPDRVEAAWRMLAGLGVTITDLRDDLRARNPMPTVGEYLPQVAAAAGPAARRTYGSYWARMSVVWADRRLDEVTATDIEGLKHEAAGSVRFRSNSRSGRHAGEHVIAAARAFYNRAIADGLIEVGASPAHQVAKPRRLPNTRRALTADELVQVNEVVRGGGNDVVLDALILRLHTETACRRGGALGLRLADLDVHYGQVRLTEKGGTQRWQPVTVDLAGRLAEHARARGAILPADTLLRYRDGRALTSRRYDHLWKRIGDQLPWVAMLGVSTHWLRHTTLTWVERHFGYGIARAYAGHTDSTGPATTTYIKGQLAEVAAALSAMTGQPHPLARSEIRP
ncbi:tyrosine-type recombinase/integrase [Hamadaea tsunoensis]|uniref:tyrosine-type recombinase/integrase n=1 Tax=Hamadaea tsunoensis TaxID=53368 RepID=UPI000412DBCC|nr:site-specific integrase [Hamadaea tsunoensis]